MQRTRLLHHMFHGELTEVTVVPDIRHPGCAFRLEVLEEGEKTALLLTFRGMTALEFSMNFFDTGGGEQMGFYKVSGKKQKRKLLERNRKRRQREREPDCQRDQDALEARLKDSELYLLKSRGGAWLVLAEGYVCSEI